MASLFSHTYLALVSSLGRRCCAILLLTATALLAPLSANTLQAQDGVIIYTVAPGDCLSVIARRYHVTVALLVARNNIGNANLIRSGQKILIPIVAPPLPAHPSTTRALSSDQPAQPADVATPAPEIQLVFPPTNPTPTVTPTNMPATSSSIGYTARGEPVYTVRRGDTLYSIGLKFGVTIQDIAARNGLRSYVIIVSQRLIIPFPDAIVSRRLPRVNQRSLPVRKPDVIPTPSYNTTGLHLLPTRAPTPIQTPGILLQ